MPKMSDHMPVVVGDDRPGRYEDIGDDGVTRIVYRASSIKTLTPSEKFGDQSSAVPVSLAMAVTSASESYQPVVWYSGTSAYSARWSITLEPEFFQKSS